MRRGVCALFGAWQPLESPAAAPIRPSATMALLAAPESLFWENKGGTPEKPSFRSYRGRGLSLRRCGGGGEGGRL